MDAGGSKSKKPSGANSPSKPPEALVFFLDRSLGKKRVATALRQAGTILHIHDDHFPPNAKDEDWLAEAGQRGWIVLTKDHRIQYRHVERLALMKAGVAAFILTSGDLQGEEMAQIFVNALPASSDFFKNTRSRSSPRSQRTVPSRCSSNKSKPSSAANHNSHGMTGSEGVGEATGMVPVLAEPPRQSSGSSMRAVETTPAALLNAGKELS